ncbi:MAG: hypothetical protein J6Q54_02185 [Oscillospiraceae bacterium]|nr:hypothetical protein [Oscillospiraceae bacterium]
MRKVLCVVLALVMILMLCSCVVYEKAIIGTWKHQNTILGVVTETTYEFKEDGTGVLTNVLPIEFTYEFVEDKLNITTNTLGIENKTAYTFKFEGDKLTLTNGDTTIVLEKD